MTGGRLIAVVGPSGVGKDSIMTGIAAALPGIGRVRRVITRPACLGGEGYDAVTEAEFAEALDRGAFCLHWRAHGLRYGIPIRVLDEVRDGQDRMANLSRDALAEAAAIFPQLTVLHVTASPGLLARRLAERGREDAEDVGRRLARAHRPLPNGLGIVEIRNDGVLSDAVAQAIAALQPVRA